MEVVVFKYTDGYDYGITVDEYSVEEARKDLGLIVEFFRNQDYHDLAIQRFLLEYRQLPKEITDEIEAFVVDEEMTLQDFPEWMRVEALGFIKNKFCLFSGRCCFPVKDVKGQVMGFIGWDPFDDYKYMDSKNYGYVAKQTTFYGMENMEKYYRSDEPVFFPEGPMCAVYLRSQGFQSLSTLGSHLSPYQIQIIRRFGRRAIMVPDNDATGDSYISQIKRYLPKAQIIQAKYGKDIEGCRKLDEHVYEEQLLTDLRNLKNPFSMPKLFIRR